MQAREKCHQTKVEAQMQREYGARVERVRLELAARAERVASHITGLLTREAA